jgi:hypothetical protein
MANGARHLGLFAERLLIAKLEAEERYFACHKWRWEKGCRFQLFGYVDVVMFASVRILDGKIFVLYVILFCFRKYDALIAKPNSSAMFYSDLEELILVAM